MRALSNVRALAFAYLCLILLESLAPFSGWRKPAAPVLTLLFEWRYSRFDLAANIVAYAPFGFLLALWFRRGFSAVASVLFAVLAGSLVSLGVEFAQVYLPGRVSSKVDLFANSAGCLAGAFAAVALARSAVMPRLRNAWFVEGGWGDAGILLVALFAVCAAKPAVPLMSNLAPNAQTLAVITNVALNFTAVALFIALIAKSRERALPLVLALLAAIVLLKLLATWLLFRYRATGLNLEAAMGVGYGLALLAVIFWRARRIAPWCAAALIAAFAFTHGHSLAFPYHRVNEQARYQEVTRLIAEWWALIALAHLTLRPRRRPIIST
jgi:VanZ family protein